LEEDEDVASAASAAAAADDDEHINAVMISSSIQLEHQQEEVTVNQWRYIPLYVDTFAEGMTFQTTLKLGIVRQS
jgi:hypothetical protein